MPDNAVRITPEIVEKQGLTIEEYEIIKSI